jgi:hypothetical protein
MISIAFGRMNVSQLRVGGTLAHEMAQILHGFWPDSRRKHYTQEPQSRCGRLDNVMKTENGMFGIIIGGIVALAAAIFIFTGGDLGGKKTIESDQDLPPIANTDR